jgi:hypothetical protein
MTLTRNRLIPLITGLAVFAALSGTALAQGSFLDRGRNLLKDFGGTKTTGSTALGSGEISNGLR